MKLTKLSAIVMCGIMVASGMAKAEIGGYGLPGDYLLEFAGDAREFGRGGTSMALADNTAAIYGNPAGLGKLRYMEALIGYTRLFADFNFYNGAFAYPLGKFGVVGIDLCGIASPKEAPEFNSFGIPSGRLYGGSDNAIMLSYGKLFLGRFGVGANVKIATQKVFDMVGAGFGADIGLSAKVFDWLQFGVSMVNIGGPAITLSSIEDRFSTSLNVGLGSQLFDKNLSINADVQIQEIIPDPNATIAGAEVTRPIHYSVGAEYYFIPYMGVRAGLNDRMIAVGTGFRLMQFSVDYAILIHRAEKDFREPLSHAFSLRYSFGKTIPEKELELNEHLREAEKKQKLRVAQRFYIDGLYVRADDSLQIFLTDYPKDPEGLKLQTQLNEKLKTQKTETYLTEAMTEYGKRNWDRVNVLLKQLMEFASTDKRVDSLNQKMVLINKNKERLALVKNLYAQNKIVEMAKELEMVLGIDSTNIEAKEYRVKIEKQIKKIDADQAYTLATKYYYDEKDVEKAHAELQKALALAPDHKEANALYEKISKEVKQLYLAKVGNMVDKDKLSVDNKDLQKLVQLDAQDRIVSSQKLYDNGQFDEAKAEIDAILKADGQNQRALALKPMIEKSLAARKAESVYNEALRLFNENQLKDAEAKAQTMIELVPDDPRYQKLLGDIQKKQRESDLVAAKQKIAGGKREDYDAAQLLVEGYLKADPQNVPAQKMLVEIKVEILVMESNGLIDKGEFEQANQALQNALKLDPDNGKVKNAFKNLKEARDILEE
jgi:tetratricopeptide (TPR) repeat protein